MVEYTDWVSDSVGGSKPSRYEVRWEGRDVRVDIIALWVAVLVSSDTMILDASSVLGAVDTRMALKGAWGGVWTAAAGSGGTAGKPSRGEWALCGRNGDVGLVEATSGCMSGVGDSDGGGRLGGGGCTVTDIGDGWQSMVSVSSTYVSCDASSSIYSEALSGIGGSGGLPGVSSSSSYSRTGDGLRTRERRSGDEAEALGPARASCGVRTTVAPVPKTPLRGRVNASARFANRGSEMRTGREGA